MDKATARARAVARSRLRRLMRSGALRKALLEYAAEQDRRDKGLSAVASFSRTAKLVTTFVELDDMRKAVGDEGTTFFKRFVAPEDNAKSVEAQAELANAENDNVWAAIRSADWEKLSRLLKADPASINSRGAVGETLLHMCYLLHSDAHTAIAHRLLELEPALIERVYEGPVYHGENVLHMAVANSDMAEARFLTRRCPRLLYGLADGIFFSKDGFGQDGNAYYGELPLSFAICTNQPEMVKFLVIDCGAIISAGDSHGNTAAHMCVFYDRLDMYDLLEELWERGYGRPASQAAVPLSAVHNKDGYTPLVLAAALGKADSKCFGYLWERTRETQWSWGSIHCRAFPLHFVDDGAQVLARQARALRAKDSVPAAAPEGGATSAEKHELIFTDAAAAIESSTLLTTVMKGRNAKAPPPLPTPRFMKHLPTALEVAIAAEDLEILTVPRVQQLLDKKWTRFAYGMFLRSMFMTVAYLAVFALTGILRTTLLVPPNEDGEGGADARRLFRPPSECPEGLLSTCIATTVGEGVVVVGALYKLHSIWQRLHNVGRQRFLKAGFMDTILSTSGCVIFLGSFAVDWAFGQEYAALPLAVASLIAWAHLGWFLLGFKTTGPFIIMIQYMVMEDLVRFATLALIFILGATQAFVLLQGNHGFNGFLDQMYGLFMTMISGDHPEIEEGQANATAQLVLSKAYVVVACILLVNLLVALFGDTFSKISELADKRYHLERARIILSLEQAMTDAERTADANKYWVIAHGQPYLLAEEKDDSVFANEERTAQVQAAVEFVKTSLPPKLAKTPSTPRLATPDSARLRSPDEGAGRQVSGGVSETDEAAAAPAASGPASASECAADAVVTASE